LRRKLNQALRKEFGARIKDRLPQFKRVGIDGLVPGQTAWCLALPEVHFFLVIVPHSKFDEFNIEVGWSKEKRYPFTISPPPFLPSHSEHLFRLVEFTWNRTGGEPWWALTDPPDNIAMFFEEPSIEDALSRIPACMDEVMFLIEHHAIPLFQAVQDCK